MSADVGDRWIDEASGRTFWITAVECGGCGRQTKARVCLVIANGIGKAEARALCPKCGKPVTIHIQSTVPMRGERTIG